MMKRENNVVLAWGLLLFLAVTALGDVAYEWEPYPYGGGGHQLPSPETGAALGAGIGGAMVFIALLPAIGAVLLAGVRSGKMPKWRAALDFALLAGLGLVIVAALVLVLGRTLADLASDIPPAMRVVSAGTVLFAAVAPFVALRTKQKSWLVAAAVLAASAIVFSACAAYSAIEEAEEKAPVTREEWNRIQLERERVYNESRMWMLEKRLRELEAPE